MSLANVAIRRLQDAPFPDFVARPAIGSLVSEARRRLDRGGPHDEAVFARERLFGNDGGNTWAVSHYLLKPAWGVDR